MTVNNQEERYRVLPLDTAVKNIQTAGSRALHTQLCAFPAVRSDQGRRCGLSGRQIQRYTPLLARKETAAAARKQRARAGKANQSKFRWDTFGGSVFLAAVRSEAIPALSKRD